MRSPLKQIGLMAVTATLALWVGDAKAQNAAACANTYSQIQSVINNVIVPGIPGGITAQTLNAVMNVQNNCYVNWLSANLSALNDVSVVEGPAINGYVLTWNNATGTWIATPPGVSSIAIGSLVTGGTVGQGLYVTTGPTLGQFAYGSGVFSALASALNGSGAISATTSPVFVTPNLGTPSAAVLTNATGLPVATGLANGALPSGVTVNNANWSGAVLSVANGGTGTASPGLIAGTNVTITGPWPNQTINSSGGGGGGNPGPYTTGAAITATGTIPAFNTTYCVNPAGSVTLTLPATPTAGVRIVLKDCTGAMSPTVTATVQSNATPSSYNLDGQATFVMNTAYQENGFWWNGAIWSVE